MSLGPTCQLALAKSFCSFPALGAYNLDNDNNLHNPTNIIKLKWGFDTAFISSRPLAGNHNQEEMNLRFAGCGCLDGIKFNRSWQFDLLDLKPVYIIEAIPLAATLF